MAGRPPFLPDDEQRRNVQVLSALGIRQDEICKLIRHKGKPITGKTLRKHFRREIDEGEIKLKARVGNFLIATIEGREIPGFRPIHSESVRGDLLQLFMKARMGWVVKTQADLGNAGGKPFVYQVSKTDDML